MHPFRYLIAAHRQTFITRQCNAYARTDVLCILFAFNQFCMHCAETRYNKIEITYLWSIPFRENCFVNLVKLNRYVSRISADGSCCCMRNWLMVNQFNLQVGAKVKSECNAIRIFRQQSIELKIECSPSQHINQSWVVNFVFDQMENTNIFVRVVLFLLVVVVAAEIAAEKIRRFFFIQVDGGNFVPFCVYQITHSSINEGDHLWFEVFG